MEKEKYEKPVLEFEEATTSSPVANTCWGYHATKKKEATTLYTDTAGAGWLSFQIGGGSCTLNLTNVTYYTDANSKGTPATEEQIQNLDSILRNSGGESGNPYKGEGTTVLTSPSSSWS